MLQRIISQAFDERIGIVQARRLAGGTINWTWFVDLASSERVVVRIAPSETEAAAGPSWLTSFGLRREQAAIRLLRPALTILPVTLAHDFSRGEIDADWVVQRAMPGQPWSAVVPALSPAARRDLWRQLGQIVQAIHAVSGEWFGPPAFGPAFATWPDLVRADLIGLLADAERYGVDTASFADLFALVDRQEADLAAVPARLIHSDLSFDHIFVSEVDGRWTVTGLIDLEFARFADPLSEALLRDLLDRDDADATAFFAGYGGRPDTSPARMEVARGLNRAWWLTDAVRRG